MSGWISCDRHGAYKKFSRLHPGILLCFCWSHLRRDFLKLAREHPVLNDWAMQWVGRIGEVFELYAARQVARVHPLAYRCAHHKLYAALRTMVRERTEQLQEAPFQGMHNNASERALRGAVVGRKNFYGSGSEWSGQLAAMMFSVFATLKRWQINPRTWLSEYLHACAAAGNRAPEDLNAFLPWNMDASRLAQMRGVPGQSSAQRLNSS